MTLSKSFNVFQTCAFLAGTLSIGCPLSRLAAAAESPTPQPQFTVPIDNPRIYLSPYVWKKTGTGDAARAEAAMPGAYLKIAFRGSQSSQLLIDGAAHRGCPPESMPVIEYSLDQGAFQIVPLTITDELYVLPLATQLSADRSHQLEIFFRAADLTQKRWTESLTHLRVVGLALDSGAELLEVPTRKRRAIGFGDSITEGVGTDGLFTSWQSLGVNNARGTWLPIACAALDCEFGQLGSGGQGMTREIHLPPLTKSWDRFDPATSRISQGLLLPEPDYIFCAMGTNDYEKDITSDYTSWLADMRKACPQSHFFCIVPPLQVHRDEIAKAVAARRTAGDQRVHLIETAPLAASFRANQGATQLAYDGVHPSQLGQAILGALIAVEAQKALNQPK